MNFPLNWYLVDCFRKTLEVADPFCAVGPSGEAFLTVREDNSLLIQPSRADAKVLLNGSLIEGVFALVPGEECFLKAGSGFFLVKGCHDPDQWMSGLNLDRWILQDLVEGRIVASVPFQQIGAESRARGLDPNTTITTVQGAQNSVYLRDALANDSPIKVNPTRNMAIQSRIQTGSTPPSFPASVMAENRIESVAPYFEPSGQSTGEFHPVIRSFKHADASQDDEQIEINTIGGEFTCPHCWQHFDRGDVMWVAKHPSLRDPDLGDEYPLRFFPTSFDSIGRAVDGMGLRCTDMACPNCKSRLPPQFLDLPSHIFSVVGAPSAGKSYFLTSMVNQLEEALPSHFGLSFQDGDASGNALLSNMRARLFSDSSSPAEIALDKTVPGGEMFRTWERDGRTVKLPKPFTYLVAPFGAGEQDQQSLHLVFYDNAGEQFEPAERSEAAESTDEDATRHLASSDVIFFLYDPATNVKFRKKISGKNDPQVSDDKFLKLNRQDNIIAEMRIRIKSELYLDANEKLDAPLAMIVGKCDLWSDLLEKPLVDPISKNGLSLEVVARNSDLIREFLLGTSPAVVGNAEAISKEVVYFPVSPIGHSPQPFVVPGGQGERIGPVPGQVAPRYVEVPVIWTLARLYPDLVKTNHYLPSAVPLT